MQTINDIDFEKLEVGEEVTFLYESSSKKKKSDDKIKATLKEDYFNSVIEKIKNNYSDKLERINSIQTDLKETYSQLAEIKGKYNKDAKEKRSHLKEVISDYLKESGGGHSYDSDDVLFFKRFTKKEINPNNAHEVNVVYIGKTIDTRNGNIYDNFVSRSGYVGKEVYENNKDKFEE